MPWKRKRESQKFHYSTKAGIAGNIVISEDLQESFLHNQNNELNGNRKQDWNIILASANIIKSE